MSRDAVDGMLPLFAAAVVAYEKVFSTRQRDEHVSPSVDELDLVALALAAQVPIYGVRGAGREAARLSEKELLDGMFWGGAMRFEMGDGFSTITQLAVRKEDLDRVLEKLKR